MLFSFRRICPRNQRLFFILYVLKLCFKCSQLLFQISQLTVCLFIGSFMLSRLPF